MKISKLRLPSRKHSDEDTEKMAADLKENGQQRPILIRRKIVFDGVLRCRAAILLGWTDIDVMGI